MKITRFVVKPLDTVTAILLAASLDGCDIAANALGAIEPAPGTAADGQYPALDANTALVQLEGIPVKGRAPQTGYSRDELGPAWADTDRNGCDARNDILARDLKDETFKFGTNNCLVTTGILADKYIGVTPCFVRGQDTSTAVQIDHIVPLSDAWQKGA